MTRNIHAVRNALLATVALLTLGATPAQATSHQTIPGNWLYLTLTTGDAHASSIRGTLLLCDPPQGHARAAEACAELATAGETSPGSRPGPTPSARWSTARSPPPRAGSGRGGR